MSQRRLHNSMTNCSGQPRVFAKKVVGLRSKKEKGKIKHNGLTGVLIPIRRKDCDCRRERRIVKASGPPPVSL